MNRGFLKVSVAIVVAVVVLLTLVLAGPIGAKPNGNGSESASINGYGYNGYCYGYCTQTPGGWGSPAAGQNVGALREAGWATAIGGSLVVGTPLSITFTGPSAVQDYLPAGGTPASLVGSYIDPTTTESGVFGGQVTALKLNVMFSAAGIGKNGFACPLGELEIASGPFEDWTVASFLAMAEAVLGGGSPPIGTISDVNDAATAINENYVDCIGDNGFLE